MADSLVRRPRADDFRQGRLAGAIGEAGEILAEGTREARRGASGLLRFGALALLLPAVMIPVFSWLPSVLPSVSPLLVVYGAVGFLCAVFWTYGFKGPWRDKLGAKRERLAAQEDTTEMRRRALASQAAHPGGFDVP